MENVISIEIYDAYIRTCETLIIKKNLNKADEKNCLLALKNKSPKLKEVKKFFIENFFIDKKQQINNNGIMTGYYEPEIKAYKYKKKIRILYIKWTLINMERLFSKARERKLIMDY